MILSWVYAEPTTWSWCLSSAPKTWSAMNKWEYPNPSAAWAYSLIAPGSEPISVCGNIAPICTSIHLVNDS